jgi:hypothetical protein
MFHRGGKSVGRRDHSLGAAVSDVSSRLGAVILVVLPWQLYVIQEFVSLMGIFSVAPAVCLAYDSVFLSYPIRILKCLSPATFHMILVASSAKIDARNLGGSTINFGNFAKDLGTV